MSYYFGTFVSVMFAVNVLFVNSLLLSISLALAMLTYVSHVSKAPKIEVDLRDFEGHGKTSPLHANLSPLEVPHPIEQR